MTSLRRAATPAMTPGDWAGTPVARCPAYTTSTIWMRIRAREHRQPLHLTDRAMTLRSQRAVAVLIVNESL